MRMIEGDTTLVIVTDTLDAPRLTLGDVVERRARGATATVPAPVTLFMPSNAGAGSGGFMAEGQLFRSE